MTIRLSPDAAKVVAKRVESALTYDEHFVHVGFPAVFREDVPG